MNSCRAKEVIELISRWAQLDLAWRFVAARSVGHQVFAGL